MGLSYDSTGANLLKKEGLNRDGVDYVIALAGNPNTGKSTVFNALTGLSQHTGNWPGKTVSRAEGCYYYANRANLLIDLPGTYSLFANSVEEQIARDYICFGRPDVTIVVTDATCLERNLNLVLQVLEITPKVVVCVNLLDEAKRKGIHVDLKGLGQELGVPVIGTVARSGAGLDSLKAATAKVAQGVICNKPREILYDGDIEAAIQELVPHLKEEFKANFNRRWLALRLLEGDQSIFSHPKAQAAVKGIEPKLVCLEW